MPADRPKPSTDDLRRYLAARAEAAAQQVADDEMLSRVAIGVGLVRPHRAPRTQLARLVIVAAVLSALVAVGYGTGVLNPRPTPSPVPTATPTPAPSPTDLGAAVTIAYPGVAIAATADAVWAADAAGELAELDPASGAVLRSVALPRPASALLITTDSVWASSDAGDLVRVDQVSLAITPVPGAVGVALTGSASAIWLGGTDEVIRIDPGTDTVTLRVPVAGRSADLGIAAVGDALWIGTRSQVVRIDGQSGAITGTLTGDASQLVFSDGRLWAVRGSELLQIDVDAVAIIGTTPGLPGTGTIVAAFDRIWVAGPPGGGPAGTVVGVVVATATIDLVGAIPASVRQLAAGAGGIWITPDPDEPAAAMYRFAAP